MKKLVALVLALASLLAFAPAALAVPACILNGGTSLCAEWICGHTEYLSGHDAVVTASALNLRSGAGTGNKVLDVLHKGDRLAVLESDGKWVKVSNGMTTGYVSAKYISYSAGYVVFPYVTSIVKVPAGQIG